MSRKDMKKSLESAQICSWIAPLQPCVRARKKILSGTGRVLGFGSPVEEAVRLVESKPLANFPSNESLV